MSSGVLLISSAMFPNECGRELRNGRWDALSSRTDETTIRQYSEIIQNYANLPTCFRGMIKRCVSA